MGVTEEMVVDNKISYEDKAIIKIVKIIAGLFILGTVLWGYNFDFSYMYELTFISNSSCGL